MAPLRRNFLAASLPIGLAALFALVLPTGCSKPQAQPEAGQSAQDQPSETPIPAEATAPAAKPDQPAADPSLQPPKAGHPKPEAILTAMVTAYRAAESYQDQGAVRIQASLGDQKVDQAVDYSVALVRPNKLRMQVYQAVAVCDGGQFRAFSQELPKQILNRPAPEKLSFLDILADEMLAIALTQGPSQTFSWVPVQLLLLWAEDPLKTILYQRRSPSCWERGRSAIGSVIESMSHGPKERAFSGSMPNRRCCGGSSCRPRNWGELSVVANNWTMCRW